jgi:hypothetical protein
LNAIFYLLRTGCQWVTSGKGVSQQILTDGRLNRVLTPVFFGLGLPFHSLASHAPFSLEAVRRIRVVITALFEFVDKSRSSHFRLAAT